MVGSQFLSFLIFLSFPWPMPIEKFLGLPNVMFLETSGSRVLERQKRDILEM